MRERESDERVRKRSFCSSSDTAGGREGGRKGSTALESIVCARITNHRRMIALLNSLSRAPLPLSTSLLRRQSLFRVGTKIEPTRRPRPRPRPPPYITQEARMEGRISLKSAIERHLGGAAEGDKTNTWLLPRGDATMRALVLPFTGQEHKMSSKRAKELSSMFR